jgi:hypothetical protein
LKTSTSVEEIFRRAQKAFKAWSILPPDQRNAATILKALDFDFFELLDAVTIARSRRHIKTFYDTKDIGKFPQRRKPLSFHCPITYRKDVMGLNDIFAQLSMLKLAVYAPIGYILPSRLQKYEEIYDTQVEGGRGKLRQADRERSLQALMTTNLLKRLESSVEAFRLTLRSLAGNLTRTLGAIGEYERFVSKGELISKVSEAIIDRRCRQHQNFGLHASANDLVHQFLISRFPVLEDVVVAEVVRLVDDDGIVVPPIYAVQWDAK